MNMNTLKSSGSTRLTLFAWLSCAALAGPAVAQVSSVTASVTSTGTGWKLLSVEDPQSGGSRLMYMVDAAGVGSLPVSQAQKDELAEDLQGQPEGTVIYLVKEIADAMDAGTFPTGFEQYTADSLSDCFGWKDYSKTKDFTFTETTLDHTFNLGDGVTGTLALTVPITGQAHLVGRYSLKRALCIPYKFKFLSASLDGNVAMNGAGSLDASVTVSQHWEKEWKLAEPEVAEFTVSVGPVPVRFVVTLPIYAGAAFTAALTGTVSASLDLAAAGTFSYYCTSDDCTGTSQFTDEVNLNGPYGSVSAQLDAQASARVMARLSVYSSAIAYVEGGLKAHADARLWGYYGNACGDADGNGTNETVEALTADLSWGYDVRYGIGGFLLPDRDWTGTQRSFPLGWRDLLGAGGSTALSPMLTGPASVDQGATASYTVKMRPCYPYTDPVTFTLAPGTWTGTTTLTPPGGTSVMQRDFPDAGPLALTVTAVSDAAGRDLQVPFSRTINVASATPTAPSALSASAQSATSVRLTWQDNSSNETGFEVQRRATPSGTFATIATAGANATSLTDSGVQQATSYEYRVRAINSGYSSAWSGVATVTTPAASPLALAATAQSPTSVRLTWQDVSTNETGFEVQRRVTPSGSFAAVTTAAANTTTFTDNGAQQSTSYEYRVRALAPTGNSAWSNAAAVTTPPVAPSGLTATAASATTVNLTWVDNSTAETGFQVQRRATPSGTFATIATAAANATTFTDGGVLASTGYEYRVRADSGGNASAWSDPVAVTTPAAPPAAPSGLSAWFEISLKRIRLNWVDNSSGEQGFQVQFSYSGSAFSDMNPPTVGAGVTSYAGGTNPPTGSYQFRVRAFANGVYSNWSNVAALIVSTPPSGYQGCYTDASTRALPVQLAGTTHTLESCKQAAYNAGYRYAGTQYYGYCFAGNTLGYTLVTDAECNTPCTSNQTQMCGGAWRNSIYATGYVPQPSASIAWIQPAENSWGPAGTLTAAGSAVNGSGGVQLVWRERADNGVWGAWQTVSYQPTPAADGSWSNTISSGNPTNKCHYFDAYVNYAGVTSPVFHYTGWTGCPQPSASIAWIQPAENSWGPAGTLTAAGYAANGAGGVQLVWRERADNGVWGAWQTVSYQPTPAADGTWSNTISSGNPTNKCHYFDAYVNYAGATSAVFHYTGWTGCP